MRALLLLLFYPLAALCQEPLPIEFDGNETLLPLSHWQELDSTQLPSPLELAERPDDFRWVPLNQKSHNSQYNTNFFRIKVRVNYSGNQQPLLVAQSAFIPSTTVGVISGNRVIYWKELGTDDNGGSAKTFGLARLPINEPGDYQLLVRGSIVASASLLRSHKLYLEEDYLLRIYPRHISRTAGLVGAMGTFWLFCLTLLYYHYRPIYLYALLFMTGAFGNIMIREGVLFFEFPLDTSWWSIYILPLAIAFAYGGALLYMHDRIESRRWLPLRRLLSSCGWIAILVGFVNFAFPIRENVAVGITGLAVTMAGFAAAVLLLLEYAWSHGKQEKLFALSFAIFIAISLWRTLEGLLGKDQSSSLLYWYFACDLVAAYVFIDYLLAYSKHYIDAKTRLTADLTRFDLVSRFSHELRTPLNAVIGLADLLQDARDTHKVKSYAGMIQSAGHTLLDLVNDILDFSKLGTSSVLLAEKPFRIDQAAHAVATTFLPRCLEANLYLQVAIEPQTPLYVIGDELRLKQILSNLISNAIKFSTPDSRIVVNFSPGACEGDQVELCISVSDNGRGIPADKIDGIFEPFAQVDAGDATQHGGTGLGLPICKMLVEQMRGTIHLDSTPGSGTTFRFNIWLQHDTNSPDINRYLRHLNGRRILLVSHLPPLYQTFVNMLQHWGAEVEVADRPDQARQSQYDLILSESLATADATFIPWLNNLPDSLPVEIYQFTETTWKDEITHPNVRFINVPAPLLDTLTTIVEHITDIPPPHTAEFANPAAHVDRHHHVLLVDDNKINLMVAGKLLESFGVSHDEACGGREALERLHGNGHGYSLVLLDCEMPDIDGFEVCRSWRRYELKYNLDRLPIVALTAHALNEVRSECLLAGMDDIIYKPVGKPALAEVLSNYPGLLQARPDVDQNT